MLEFTVSLVGIDGQEKLENAISAMKQEGAADVQVDRQDFQMVNDPSHNTGIIRAIVFARDGWSRGEIDSFLTRLRGHDVFAEP